MHDKQLITIPLDLAEELLDFLDDRSDADWDGEAWRGNSAAYLHEELSALIEEQPKPSEHSVQVIQFQR